MKAPSETTILIDLDDTLEDLLGCWVQKLNEEHNLNVNPKDINDWDIGQFFPTLTRYQVFEPLFNGDFWDSVKPKENAVKYVKKLKDDGYRIFICTNTNYKHLKDKMEKVLFKYFDFLSWNDVIVTTNKQIIDADFLVDDGVHNLVGGKYKKLLMTAPHNEKYDANKNDMIRVNSWEEVYNVIAKSQEGEVMDNIILYTINCPICKRIEQMLDKKNISYTLCTDESLMSQLGIETLPVLSVNGKLLQAKAAMEYINEV